MYKTTFPPPISNPPSIPDKLAEEDKEGLIESFNKYLEKDEVEIDFFIREAIPEYFRLSAAERNKTIEDQIRKLLLRGIFMKSPPPISQEIIDLLDVCSKQLFFKEDSELQEHKKKYSSHFYYIVKNGKKTLVLSKKEASPLSDLVPKKFVELYEKFKPMMNKKRHTVKGSTSLINNLFTEMATFLRNSEYEDEKKQIILSCLIEMLENNNSLTIALTQQLFFELRFFLQPQHDSTDYLTSDAKLFCGLFVNLKIDESFFIPTDVLPKILALLASNPTNVQLIKWKITVSFYQNIRQDLTDQEIKIIRDNIECSKSICLGIEPHPQVKVEEIKKLLLEKGLENEDKVNEIRANLIEYAEIKFFSGLLLLQDGKIPQALGALFTSILIHPDPMRLNSLVNLMQNLAKSSQINSWEPQCEDFFFCMRIEESLTQPMITTLEQIGVITVENSKYYDFKESDEEECAAESKETDDANDASEEMERPHKTSPALSPQKDPAELSESAKRHECAVCLFARFEKLKEKELAMLRKRAKTEISKKDDDEMKDVESHSEDVKPQPPV